MTDRDDKDFVRDIDDLKEVLDVVSDRVPLLLRGLRDVLYSKDSAEAMADAVGTFYKRLIESGIPRDEASAMTRGYMVNLRDLLGSKGLDLGDLRRRRSDDE